MDVVVYAGEDAESEAMRSYLLSRGMDFRLRSVESDAEARREWEDLDGQVTPIVVIDQRQIVRGLDRSRLDQLTGWIGC